jgi:hypothetical protein
VDLGRELAKHQRAREEKRGEVGGVVKFVFLAGSCTWNKAPQISESVCLSSGSKLVLIDPKNRIGS